LTTLAVATVVMLLGYLVFGVVPVNIPLLLVVILCIALGFVGVMMLVATVSKTAGGSSGLGRAVLLMLAMIGGGSIPLFLMPPWMRAVSSISPFKWAIEALDGAIWRRLSPAEIAVPCAVLLGMGIVGFLAGTRLFQWSSQA
jgi:ABC-2 type transport system permease protein